MNKPIEFEDKDFCDECGGAVDGGGDEVRWEEGDEDLWEMFSCGSVCKRCALKLEQAERSE